jgi:hypothetical protein
MRVYYDRDADINLIKISAVFERANTPRLDPMGPAGNRIRASGRSLKASALDGLGTHGLVMAHGNVSEETR